MEEATYYYLYQITNLVNGKIYVGVHRTTNIDDGYMGSGKQIKLAQAKYGLSNFKKEILEFFQSEEAMYDREAEVVDSSFIRRPDVYNMIEGGKHGIGWSWLTPELRRIYGQRSMQVRKANPEAIARWNSGGKRWRDSNAGRQQLEFARQRANSPEAQAKRKKTFKEIGHAQGSKNSAYGKHWITNGTESRLVRAELEIPPGWRRGRVLGKTSCHLEDERPPQKQV